MQQVDQLPDGAAQTALPAGVEHPRGTLAIVLIFGLLLALGWLAMYVFVFLERGAPHS
jgi:hypothetical protein